MFLIDDIIWGIGAGIGALWSAATSVATGAAVVAGSAAVGGAIGGLIGLVIEGILDESSISNEVRIKCPEALKIEIEKKKHMAVDVGIFNKSEDKIATGVEIQSEQGVSDNLYVGQIIYV